MRPRKTSKNSERIKYKIIQKQDQKVPKHVYRGKVKRKKPKQSKNLNAIIRVFVTLRECICVHVSVCMLCALAFFCSRVSMNA